MILSLHAFLSRFEISWPHFLWSFKFGVWGKTHSVPQIYNNKHRLNPVKIIQQEEDKTTLPNVSVGEMSFASFQSHLWMQFWQSLYIYMYMHVWGLKLINYAPLACNSFVILWKYICVCVSHEISLPCFFPTTISRVSKNIVEEGVS